MTSRRRMLAAALALLAVLAAVAVGSRGAARGGRGPGDLRLPASDGALTIVAVLAAVVSILILMFGVRGVRPNAARPSRSLLATLLGCLAAALFIAVLLAVLHPSQGHQRERQPAPSARPGQEEARPLHRVSHGDFAIVVGVVLAGALVAAAAVRRANPSEPDAAGAALARALSDVLDDAIDDLRALTDPRLAVIAAYDRMEQALAFGGVARRRAETPLEYLGRALVRLHASAWAVEQLTALFEEAMFSVHPIGLDSRDEAIAALVAVRDELRAPVPA